MVRCTVAAALALAAAAHAPAVGAQPATLWPPANTIGTPVPLDGRRPVTLPGVLRSQRAPIAVHIGTGVDARYATLVLAAAERACDGIELRAHLPLPAPDGDRGGGSDLDIYVTRDGPAVETVVDALDTTSLWDTASAFVHVRAVSDPEALARAVSEGITQAVVLGVNADPPIGEVRALGAAIASVATGLPADPVAVRAFAREPWRSPFATEEPAEDGPHDPSQIDADRGAGLFFDHIFRKWDDDRHRLLADLVWAAVQHTPEGAPRLWDEPDVFDVLRRLFATEPGDVAGMMLDTAVDRALAGTVASEDQLGDAIDPGYAAVPLRTLVWRDLPAWVESPVMLEPMGMAVVTVDLANAPIRPSISVWLHASVESHWVASVVRVGGTDGRAVTRLDSQVITDGTWSADAESLDGVSRLVIVAMDLGVEDYEPDIPPVPDGFVALHIAPSR